jgi:hypothetical protein
VGFPVVEGTRFEPFRLDELFDYRRHIVRELFKSCKTARDVAELVIRTVEYPLYRGEPDDRHVWNHYHGKWCRVIEEDYWQTCSETALFLIGDCEDSSVLTVGGMRLLGVSSQNVYEVFGLVRDASTGEVLGGHGWVYVRDPSFGTDKFVLVETTLDVPPSRYPEVCSSLDDLKRPYRFESVIYEPEQLFNDEVYIELRPLIARKRSSRRVHEAIERAWGIESKYMKALRRSLSYRIKRWLGLG